MYNSVWAMLNEAEKELLRDSEPSALKGLDEDELLALHDRIRRARNKYSKLYRRRAAGQVGTDAARARAHAKHAKTAAKAEAFEDALARVSRTLAQAAKASAAELKAERLAMAAKGKGSPKRSNTTAEGGAKKDGKLPASKKKRATPASKKARASSRASNKRSEASRGR